MTIAPKVLIAPEAASLRRPGTWWEPALWFAGYLAMGAVVYQLQGDIIPVLWYPPIAIGTAALLTFGWRALPFLYLADFLVTWPKTPEPISAPLISAASTTIECAVAFVLLSRAGVTSAMTRARDVPLALLLAGCLATGAGATMGTGVAVLAGVALRESSPLIFWFDWWLCDAISMVVLLPVLLLWLAPADTEGERLEPGGRVELALLVLAALLLGVAALLAPALGDMHERLPWLGLGASIAMWAAARFSRRVTASIVALLAAAAFGVVRGEFLLARMPHSQIDTLLRSVQLEVALLSMGGLALNSHIARERRISRQLEATAEALRRSAQAHSLAARAGRLGTWEIDVATGRAHWADELYELLGFAPQSFDPFVKPRPYIADAEVSRMLDRRLAEHVERGGRIEFELPLRAADGRRLWCEVRGEDIQREGRRVLAGTVADVTERRALEQQFLQAQKMEVVGRLAGGVAHDFNNVLTAILGFTELATMNVPDASPSREYLAQVRQAALRAAALTQRLLAFSRMQPQEVKPVEVDALLRRLEPMLQRLLGDHVRMHLTLGAARTTVLADATEIEQVLMNLVVNARDAMPGGGRLEVTTRVDARARAGESARDGAHTEHTGSLLRICVSDTGDGMDEATRARIFEPFFTTKSPGQGTGLGLSTVLGIVRQAGGVVVVESALGHGSSFTVELPVHEGPAESASDEHALRPGPGGRETLLLVEDDPLVCEFVRTCLEQAGYRVIVAVNGELALEALEAQRALGLSPALLVTDVTMPGMNGVELARRVLEQLPGLPVLFMTGYTRIFEPGGEAADFPGQALAKPFASAELLQRVRAALEAPGDQPRA